MKQFSVLSLLPFLIACTAIGAPVPTQTPLPSRTALPSATPTAVPSSTFTATVTETATATATSVPTAAAPLSQLHLEATAAPETAYTYVFPVADAKTTYGRTHHDYMATDIFCPVGSTFVAVTSGTVESVIAVDTWDAATDDPALRSGLAVGIIGDDGNRYYGSHLSAIAPGITPGLRVNAGDILGYTGKSGNAANTPPHVHFGISRPTTPDDWQIRRGEMNPFVFLNAWKAGTSLQPVFAPQP